MIQADIIETFNLTSRYFGEIVNKMYSHELQFNKSNRKAMNCNWSNQKENPALKTKAGNK